MTEQLSTPLPRLSHPSSTRQKARAGLRLSASSPGDVHRFKRTLKDARTGLLESQYQVGLMLAAGVGTNKNLDEALTWVTRAAERGHAGAQFMLGAHFAPEPGTAPRGQLDEARAMSWLFVAAQQGHARAHHRLAQLLRQSAGALSAHHEAAAASAGLAEAQLALARQQLGNSAEIELRSSGRAWLRRAADQGLPAAQTAWGQHIRTTADATGDPQEGIRWLQAAAEQAWPPAVWALHERGISPPALPVPPTDPIDAEARFALGQLFAAGTAGLSPSIHQARQWWTLAASQNHGPAHVALGRLAEDRDPEEALAHYRRGATLGDAAAHHGAARLLRAPGRSTDDTLEALSHLAQAAAQGHAPALMDLFDLMHAEAKGHAEATSWARAALTHAAEAGDAEGQFRQARELLKLRDDRSTQEAAHWLEKAAVQRHTGACAALGHLLRQGPPDLRDSRRGWQFLQDAATAGEPTAQWHVSLTLAAGADDVVRDPAAALSHCRAAAEAGFVPAMATMGVLCATLDRPDDAVHWWRQAAHAGDIEAQFNLAQALHAGRGVEADEPQALRWLLEAAEGGLVQAQAELGVRYASGQGVPQDGIEAHKWFFIARLGGSAAAGRNTELSQQRLPPEHVQEGERRARSWRASQKRHG